MSHVADQRSAFRYNDYVRNEVFDTFYKDYLEFKHYMNDIIKTISPSSEMVTNLSNYNVSFQTKIKSLEEEIKSLKNENSNLKDDIKTQLKVIENLSRFENRHCENSVTNEAKVNVNYESDDLKNGIQWQLATSRNKRGHSTNTRKNTLERNRKSNDIHFEITFTSFSTLHNDNQNLTTKRPTSTIPNIPEKIPTNSRNTSPHSTNAVRNKRPLARTNKNYLKNFVPFTVRGNSDCASIIKNGRLVLVVGDNHVKRIRRNDFNKELKNSKAIFRSFSGAKTKQFDHYIPHPLVDDKSDAVIIHVGTKDILTNTNHKEIARNIIKIGLNRKNYSVNDLAVSSILVEKNRNLNVLIQRVNDLLRDLCSMNGFGYICNDAITTEYLWKDGIHLQIWAQIF